MHRISRPGIALLLLALTACSAAAPGSGTPEGSDSASPVNPTVAPSTAAPPQSAEPAAGGTLAFLRDLELILLDVATGTETATGVVGVTPVALTGDGQALIGYRTIVGNPHEVSLVRQPLDGADATVLAETVPHLSARPSPDGRVLAFASNRAAPGGIVLVSLDHGDATQLTTAGDTALVWSPDGKLLATSRLRANGGSDLYLVEAATGASRQVTDDEWEDAPFAWTDDGSAVLTTSHRGGDGTKFATFVWQVDVPSGELTQRDDLKSRVLDFSFPSPNGMWDARLSQHGRLMITEPGRAVGSRVDTVDIGVHLTWSPNGAWLVWTKFSAPGESDLYLVHVPDGEPTQLTSTPGAESHPVWGPVRHGF